jgi:riboflavin kinase
MIAELQYTDYGFYRYCADRFGINRGIYNTVDEWFYHHGYHDNIVERRQQIICFMDFLAGTENEESSGKVKIGVGGLRSKFTEFAHGKILQTGSV